MPALLTEDAKSAILSTPVMVFTDLCSVGSCYWGDSWSRGEGDWNRVLCCFGKCCLHKYCATIGHQSCKNSRSSCAAVIAGSELIDLQALLLLMVSKKSKDLTGHTAWGVPEQVGYNKLPPSSVWLTSSNGCCDVLRWKGHLSPVEPFGW